MEGFIQDVLNQHIVKGKANTPALTNLFEVRESPLLNEEKRKEFHSITAKLLYLAKRVRPDILTTVSYLSTRVTKANEDDWKRLDRLLKYLNYDPTSGITLKPGDGDITIRAYADASYGIHEDGKSHSGLCIALGEGPVIDSGEIKLEYIPTEEMAADTLTKPLVGTKFKELKAKLLNWYI
eukprot:gene14285-15796_t